MDGWVPAGRRNQAGERGPADVNRKTGSTPLTPNAKDHKERKEIFKEKHERAASSSVFKATGHFVFMIMA